MILFGKSGININPKNKGKFTKYCNGKVTSECILRGKHSPSKKIRKMAIFAENARKFKHADGGTLEKNYIYDSTYTGDGFFDSVSNDTFETSIEGDDTPAIDTFVPFDEEVVIGPKATQRENDEADWVSLLNRFKQNQSVTTGTPSMNLSKVDFYKLMKDKFIEQGYNPDLASAMSALTSLETTFGKDTIGTYNYGNITAGSSWTGPVTNYFNKQVNKSYKFRNYGSLDEYIKDAMKLYNKRHITSDMTGEQALRTLEAAHYAEEGDWFDRITKLKNQYDKLV